MAITNQKNWASLKKAWEDYGHYIKWDDLLDIKHDREMYAVVVWQEGDHFIVADLERPSVNDPWDMLNDGYEPMSWEQWEGATIPELCNWFRIPSAEEVRQQQHARFMEIPRYRDTFHIYNEGYDDALGVEASLDAWHVSNTRAKLMKTIKLPKSK